MKLKKNLRIGNRIIPAGTNLDFSNEGYATYKGVRIHENQIPEVAIEAARVPVSQKRSNVTLCKSLRLGNEIIPSGTKLAFSNEGYATYNGNRISIYQIPTVAIEAAQHLQGGVAGNEALSPVKLKKSLRMGKEIIAAGTELMFGTEGMADYNGKQISIYQIPTAAIEMDAVYEGAHNKVDTEDSFKEFDNIEPGDKGYGADGQAVTFLGKAVGPAGYDALVNQFGNASGKTFDDTVAGLTDDEIKDAHFVCYTTVDGTVCVGLYGADHVAAVEADGQYLPIDEVESGDKAVCSEGKPCTVIAKGQGSVWYKNMTETLQLENGLDEIKDKLGIDDDDASAALNDVWFILAVNDKNEKWIDVYGDKDTKVFPQD